MIHRKPTTRFLRSLACASLATVSGACFVHAVTANRPDTAAVGAIYATLAILARKGF